MNQRRSKTAHSSGSRPRLTRRAAALALTAVCGVLVAVSPALADNGNSDDAAASVFTAVTRTYPGATSSAGRAVETTCSGATPKFKCLWWVIKNRFERKATPAETSPTSTSVLSRKGEGVQHTKASRVKFSGSASVTWICIEKNKKGVCKDGAYSVSLK